MTLPALPATIRDLIGLVARIALGVVLTAHGCQKLFEWTMSGTAEAFAGMGVPAPSLSAWIAALVEFGGGILIVFGAFQTIVGILVAVQMLAAWIFAHTGNGLFVADGGPELVIMIAVAGLLIAAFGSGRFSVDTILARRKQPGIAESAA